VLITFEGFEGSGKSTVIHSVCLNLKKSGVPFAVFREPGSTYIGEKIRDILLDTKVKKLSIYAETLLYIAARSQLIYQNLLPELKSNKVVICDRFLDSTIAYQGYGLGVDIKWIKNISKKVNFNVFPDLTVLIDVPVDLGLKRSGRKDRIEKRKIEYHRRVRQGYLDMSKKEPKRFFVISGNQPFENVLGQAWGKIRDVVVNANTINSSGQIYPTR
jgi:dTMP kinase